MKVQVTQQVCGFGGVTSSREVVIELPDGSDVPEGGTRVPDDTPVGEVN